MAEKLPTNDEIYGSDCDYGMADTHAKLLTLLDEFHRRCEESGVKYSLHGGCLLGAVRTGRFIPWDDDVDVVMTREHYEKFKATQSFIGSNLHLDETSMWFPRLVMSDNSGVYYIDLLIYDYISSNPVEKTLKLTLLRALQGMMKKEPEYEKFGVGNKFLLWSTHAFGSFFSDSLKARIYGKLEQGFAGQKQLIHRSNDAFHAIAEMHDSSFMDEYQLMRFEGRELYVNKRYEEFLIAWYGPDYMTPPPPEKRVPIHSQFRTQLRR